MYVEISYEAGGMGGCTAFLDMHGLHFLSFQLWISNLLLFQFKDKTEPTFSVENADDADDLEVEEALEADEKLVFDPEEEGDDDDDDDYLLGTDEKDANEEEEGANERQEQTPFSLQAFWWMALGPLAVLLLLQVYLYYVQYFFYLLN